MPRTLLPGQSCDLYIYDLQASEPRLRFQSRQLLLEAPNWTPDGHDLVLNGDGRLWRLGVSSGELVEIPMHGVLDINNDHVISPDGTTVYVSSDDGHIYAVPYAGTGPSPRVSIDKGESFRHYLHGISPDGTTLSYIGLQRLPSNAERTNVYLLEIASQEEHQLTDDDYADDGAEFSADGRLIYFNSDRGSTDAQHAQLFRIPVAGGQPEQLTRDSRVNWFPHPSPDGQQVAYVSFPPRTVGHPADVDVIVRVRDEQGSVRDLMALFGGQGTMNVASWSPDGNALAFVGYPID